MLRRVVVAIVGLLVVAATGLQSVGATSSASKPKIVFVSDRGHSGADGTNLHLRDIWTMDADGTNAQMIVEIPSSTAGIAWSPDGNWIAYAVADRGDIMLVHPYGTGSKRLTHEEDVFHSEPAWQPRP